MTAQPGTGDWIGTIPELAALDAESAGLLSHASRKMAAPAGTKLFGEGSPCQAYLILLAGQVRVQKTAENGREIALYRIGPGQTCVVTTVCLMTGTDYDAEGVAETDIEAQALPMAAFRALLAKSERFRDFVFRAYSVRITDLLLLLEEVSFGRIDQRLAACLLERGRSGEPENEVLATHQELAAELGTAREVVSRQLKEFEHRGWIGLARGRIVLRDLAALAGLARK